MEPTKDSQILELVRWWERKRVYYNLIIGAVGSVTLLLFGRELLFVFPYLVFSRIIIYAIVANAFYTLGWGYEVLFMALSLKKGPIGKSKKLLFGLGIGFSLFVTVVIELMAITLLSIELH